MNIEVNDNIEYIVDQLGSGCRLDRWLSDQISHLSRSKVKTLIVSGSVFVNGKKALPSQLLYKKDQVKLIKGESSLPLRKLLAVKMDLDIVFEDQDLLLINKPAGIAIHPTPSDYRNSLVEGLLAHCKDLYVGDKENYLRPGVVHRLDKDTTGLVVFVKNEKSFLSLKEQFKFKKNLRSYLAILDGVLNKENITYESFLKRNSSHRDHFESVLEKDSSAKELQGRGYRFARSHFKSLAIYGHKFSLARIRLETGRTHQIRVHAQELNCPVLGDPVYNFKRDFPHFFSLELRSFLQSLSHQLLHAEQLGFFHPRDQRWMLFQTEPHENFQKALQGFKKYEVKDYKYHVV